MTAPALAWLILAAAFAAGPPVPSSRQLLVVTAWTRCDSHRPDLDFRRRVETDADRFVQAVLTAATNLRLAGPVLRNPSRPELLAALSALNGPFWFVYSGHSHHLAGRSAVCLRGTSDADDLLLDALVASVPAGPSGSFWFNGCFTAAVDVRRPGTSVFSAATAEIDSGLDDTPVGAALADVVTGPPKLPRSADTNCDGLVTDGELLRSLKRALPPATENPPRPKLRSQAWGELPLFSLKSPDTSCKVTSSLKQLSSRFPPLTAVLAQEERFRLGSVGSTTEWPAVVWTTRDRGLWATHRAPPVWVVGTAKDLTRLPLTLLTTPVWQISGDRELVVRDGRDPDLPPLWRGSRDRLNAQDGQALEREILRIAYGPDTASRSVRKYRRPVFETERGELVNAGFSPCACSEDQGQCFCNPVESGAQP